MEDIYNYTKSILTQPDRSMPQIEEDITDIDEQNEAEYTRNLINKKANEKKDNDVTFFSDLKEDENNMYTKKKVIIVKKNNIVMPTINKTAVRQFNPRLPIPIRKKNEVNETFILDTKEYPSL